MAKNFSSFETRTKIARQARHSRVGFPSKVETCNESSN